MSIWLVTTHYSLIDFLAMAPRLEIDDHRFYI